MRKALTKCNLAYYEGRRTAFEEASSILEEIMENQDWKVRGDLINASSSIRKKFRDAYLEENRLRTALKANK